MDTTPKIYKIRHLASVQISGSADVDDNTNATDDEPYPGTGDLVRFGGMGLGCKQVVVDGADVSDVEFKRMASILLNTPAWHGDRQEWLEIRLRNKESRQQWFEK
jgi:hypothetical protein